MSAIVQKDSISFKLCKEDFTCEIIQSPNASGDIFLPISINYQSQEYKIISIKKGAFKKNYKIKSLYFPEDSKLRLIETKAFKSSSIQNLFIPASVEELEDGWCRHLIELNDVKISPENKNFKYLDDDRKIIVGKSDKNTDIFDTIIFACRDIKYVKIPKHIKYIKPYAFDYCEKIKKIEIPENSEIISIGKKSFANNLIKHLFIPASVEELEDGWCRNLIELNDVKISPENKNFKYLDDDHKIIVGKSDKNTDIFDTIIFACRDIKYVKIPKHIKYIKPYAFDYCDKIKKIEIPENSEIISIGKKSFDHNLIKHLFIPASVEELEDGWCRNLIELNDVKISPENKNFKYLDDDHKIIVGKSDKNTDIFDTIIFACRDIKYVKIPKHIKYIKSDAFANCSELKKVEIPKDSELISIGRYTFKSSGITKITIPKNVFIIRKNAFGSCRNLKKVVFDDGSNLSKFGCNLFNACDNLKIIKIPNDSNISSIKFGAFGYTKIKSLFIPKAVDELEDGWCKNLNELTSIIISPENKNFKYLDDENKIIVGKSDKNNDIFDTIIFACRDIEQVKTSKQIKYIKSYAFENCKKLKTLEISDESNIKRIEDYVICGSSIENIFIGKNIKHLSDMWCHNTPKLHKVIISKENEYIKYLDSKHQIIISRRSKEENTYDTINFASRFIDKAIIPKSIKYIKSCSFMGCQKLKSIENPDDSELCNIGSSAFESSSIREFTITKNVEIIESSAFKRCKKLDHVIIKEGSKLQSIGSDLFAETRNLTSISIPENSSLKIIQDDAFMESSLESIYIPSSVEEIEENFCFWAKKLKTVIISPGNKHFKYLNDDHTTIIGKSDINDTKFDTIVFVNRNIKQVIIPEEIKYIYPNAFADCDEIETIKMSKDSKIRKFESCFHSESLNKIIFSSNFEGFDGNWCFIMPNLTSIIIPPENKNLKYLDENHKIIVGKSDKNIDIFDTINFACRDIEYAKIPKHIRYIKSNAFKGCHKLKAIDFPVDSELVSIGSLASTSITKIKIPKSVSKIKSNAFEYCHDLQSFKLQKGSKLQSFDSNLFSVCFSLNTIEIDDSSSLKKICKDVFSYTPITNLYIPASFEEFEDGWCNNAKKLMTVIISPENKNFKYLDDENKIIVGKSDKNNDIFDTIIFACRDIEQVKTSKQIKYIKSYAFENCKKLKTLEISDESNIKRIEDYVICGSSIENIFIGKNIKHLSDMWCHNTPNLHKVIISKENEYIKYLDSKHQIIISRRSKEENAYDTINFASRFIDKAIIPKSIKYIKSCSFMGCQKLKSIEIPDDSELCNIGSSAFESSSIVGFKTPRNICKYDNGFLRSCHQLLYFKFLGDSLTDSSYDGIFSNCKNMILASFPNLKTFDISRNNFNLSSDKFRIYFSAGTEIIRPS